MQPIISTRETIAEVGHTTVCKNCKNSVSEKYCGHCGQPGLVKAIGWRNLGEEFTNHWLGMNNRFSRTLIHLFSQPEQVIQQYLRGNRVQYLGPLSYYLVITAIVLLVFSVFQVDVQAFMKAGASFNPQQESSPEAEKYATTLLGFMSGAFRYLSILLLPFYILAVKTFFSRRFNNALEITVLLLYLFSQPFLLILLQGLSFQLGHQSLNGIAMVLNLLYYGWLFGRFFSPKFSWKNGIKGAFVYVAGIFYFTIAVGAFTAFYMLIY